MVTTDEDANDQHKERVLKGGEWIDAVFLGDVLSESLQDDVKVVDFTVAAAVAAGDNYFSTLYRISTTYTTSSSDEQQHKSIMIKGISTNTFLQNLAEKMGAFVKEEEMYKKVLPVMQRYTREYFMPDSKHVAPEAYKCARENTIVMEDICAGGYKMVNRLLQMDLNHCIVTMRSLARFHALSVKLCKEYPEYLRFVSLHESFRESTRGSVEPIITGSCLELIKAVRNWGENARFAPQLEELVQYIWEKFMYIIKEADGFNVINHADLWSNNILYEYDEDGNVIHAKLVDFQLIRYASPACDLFYFFFTSAQGDVLVAHMMDMLTVYHESLIADLAMLGQEVYYPFEQLQEDMLDRAIMSIFCLVQILPVALAPPSQTDEMFKNDEEGDHPMMRKFMHWRYRAAAGKYLNYLESIGYLDAAKERMQPLVDRLEAMEAERIDSEEEREESAKSSPRSAQESTLLGRLMRMLRQPICE